MLHRLHTPCAIRFKLPGRYYVTNTESKRGRRRTNAEPLAGIVKTTKKFKDLPSVLIQDGIPAKPLPDFQGGLENTLDHQALSSTDCTSIHPQLKRSNRTRMAKSRNKVLSEETTRTSPQKTQDEPSASAFELDQPDIIAIPEVIARLPSNELAQGILANLKRFPHCVLLTRVGQFYESYFEQAIEVAKLLSIKLTSRKWDGQDVLMAGFPVLQLDRHLKTLVQLNQKSVAMCEEFRHEDDPDKISRKVRRIITPGTLIDEPFLNEYENNYLLAIGPECISKNGVGLAWIDVSTGDFFSEKTTIESLCDGLARINPREVVLHQKRQSVMDDPINQAVQECGYLASFLASDDHQDPPLQSAVPILHDCTFPEETYHFSVEENSAILLLMSFLKNNLLDCMPSLSLPSRQSNQSRMQMDMHTIHSLEIREGMREGGSTGSLLGVIKRTVTRSGTRLLTRWLCSPSISLTEITARQSIVMLFFSRPHLRADIIQLLKGLEDISRIVQKFLLNRGDPVDLLGIQQAISSWSEIQQRLALERQISLRTSKDASLDDWSSLDRLLSESTDLELLASRITAAIDDFEIRKRERLTSRSQPEEMMEDGEPTVDMLGRPPYGPRWKLKAQASEELTQLHDHLVDLIQRKGHLEQRLQNKYSVPSLSLRISRSLGLHVHLAKAKRDRSKLEGTAQFVTIQQSGSTQAYVHVPWTQLGMRIVQAVSDIATAERVVFKVLRDEVSAQTTALRRNAHIMDEIDVACAFAQLASELNFVRPRVTQSTILNIKDGRHPTVELGLLQSGRTFVPNDISMHALSRIHVITGPNMGGKSTLLRQTALIAILAQTGSFVPATEAEIGLVDKVFSRVGAKDDIFRDRSTFMVEMLETAGILHKATERSLVIMDEVGRGTTFKDGLAIAFATVNHLYGVNKSRVLFATHFHEVADLLGYSWNDKNPSYPNINFFCNDVDETMDGSFSYSHRIKAGVNRSSHGLKVARLGGLPSSALVVAERTLSSLQEHSGALTDRRVLYDLGKSLSNRCLD